MKKKTISICIAGLILTAAIFYGLTQGILDSQDKTKQGDFIGTKVTNQIKNFQKIDNVGLAVQAVGDVMITHKYLATSEYNFNHSSDANSNKSYAYLDVYEIDKGMSSHKRLDLIKLLRKYNSTYELEGIEDGYNLDSEGYKGVKLKLFHPFNDIELTYDIDRQKFREIKPSTDKDGEESSSSSWTTDSYHPALTFKMTSLPAIDGRLKKLSVDGDFFLQGENQDNKLPYVNMKAYRQENPLLLYKKYPEIEKMAQNGSYQIYLRKNDSEKEVANFFNLMNKEGEAPFFSEADLSSQADYFQTRVKFPYKGLDYSRLLEKAEAEGKASLEQGIFPIGLDLETGEVVSANLKKSSLFTNNFSLTSIIEELYTRKSSTKPYEIYDFSQKKSTYYSSFQEEEEEEVVDPEKLKVIEERLRTGDTGQGPDILSNWSLANFMSLEDKQEMVKNSFQQGGQARIYSLIELPVSFTPLFTGVDSSWTSYVKEISKSNGDETRENFSLIVQGTNVSFEGDRTTVRLDQVPNILRNNRLEHVTYFVSDGKVQTVLLPTEGLTKGTE